MASGRTMQACKGLSDYRVRGAADIPATRVSVGRSHAPDRHALADERRKRWRRRIRSRWSLRPMRWSNSTHCCRAWLCSCAGFAACAARRTVRLVAAHRGRDRPALMGRQVNDAARDSPVLVGSCGDF